MRDGATFVVLKRILPLPGQTGFRSFAERIAPDKTTRVYVGDLVDLYLPGVLFVFGVIASPILPSVWLPLDFDRSPSPLKANNADPPKRTGAYMLNAPSTENGG